ncbi:phage holin family protein [Sorangium sp. So ce1182]|uniref:phage holin family protein n=1 Tax=Sorangium sp. So ce1182 TaxID=3133334 RepID=UPI003F60342C
MANNNQAEESGLVDLVKGAIQDTQELIRIEIALAKNETKQDVSRLKNAAIAFGVAAAAAILMLAMLLVAAVLAIGGPAPALIIAAVLLVAAGIAGLVGYRLIPRDPPLDATKEHAEAQANVLKEKIA